MEITDESNMEPDRTKREPASLPVMSSVVVGRSKQPPRRFPTRQLSDKPKKQGIPES